MDRVRQAHRTSRRLSAAIALAALVTGSLALLQPSAGGVVSTCRARDLTKGTPSRPNLQPVIDAADPGDTIAVKYVCYGHFVIDKNLRLIGKATLEAPRPVLYGGGSGRTLRTSAKVTLTNLKIMDGAATGNGGGISNTGTLTLIDSLVRGNTGASGGGISSNGTLTLKDTVVRNNEATTYGGGGIYNHSGTVILLGSTSVRRNQAAGRGGGIMAQVGDAIITLKGASSVNHNTAHAGGGIFNERGALTLNAQATVGENSATTAGGIAVSEGGIVTMNGQSSVHGNTTAGWGGGIYLYASGGNAVMNDSSSVTANTADSDDAPPGDGGGVYVSCGDNLIGGVDGGNVHGNFLGTADPVENNVVTEPCG